MFSKKNITKFCFNYKYSLLIGILICLFIINIFLYNYSFKENFTEPRCNNSAVDSQTRGYCARLQEEQSDFNYEQEHNANIKNEVESTLSEVLENIQNTCYNDYNACHTYLENIPDALI